LILQERIPIEEVFEQLKCTREGLSSDEGANRLQIFGPNKLEEKKVFFIEQLLTILRFFGCLILNFRLKFDDRKANSSSFWALCGIPYHG